MADNRERAGETLPVDLRLEFDDTPSPELRAHLAREINAFHAITAGPPDSLRFALLARDADGAIRAGVVGSAAWRWLFIEAMWVAADRRGHGLGRILLGRAEAHGVRLGCHSVWLDTFQAREFYEALGYETFGVLEDYPGPQNRIFMRKRLGAAAQGDAP